MFSRRLLFPFLLSSAGALLTAAPCSADAAKAGTGTHESVTQLVERLKATHPKLLFDFHGNASDDAQRLMVQRFSATVEVMRHIDALDGEARHAPVRQALFGVLGFVKDPASIAWLRGKRESDAPAFYDDYLPSWQSEFYGFGGWPWLTGRDLWIAFWIEAFTAESTIERRLALIEVIAQFDDERVVAFFRARRTEAAHPQEVLLVEAYLGAHDVPAQSDRIVPAIAVLARMHRHDFLMKTASHLRHEAFVPYLVGVADRTDPGYTEPDYPAERALEAITFECGLHGKKAWQDWLAQHGTQGRAAWMQRATDSFTTTLAANPKDAAAQFEKLVYCWNDIVMLPFVEHELAPHTALHSSIAGWINLTYSHFRRERLRPLAERMRAGGHLAGWARGLLQQWGYIPNPHRRTWADVVRWSNMRL